MLWKPKYSIKVLLVAGALFLSIFSTLAFMNMSHSRKLRIEEEWYVRGAIVLFDDADGHVTTIVADMAPGAFDTSALAHLYEHPFLEYLVLTKTSVTDSDLSHVKGLRKLKSLGLKDTRITDSGLAEISNLTNLEFLFVQNTSITDSGVPNILKLRSLKELGIRGTKISQKGLVRLQRGLPTTVIYYTSSTKTMQTKITDLEG